MENDKELESLLPAINLNLQQPLTPEREENLISDQVLIGVYSEIMDNLRKERVEIDGLIQNFADMVINNGDSTSASKEALVNLIKIKSDTADKMSKVADLMTRVKLKSHDTFPRYLALQQTNNLGASAEEKKEILKLVNKAKKAQIKDGK
jgi:hypothetical protein